LNDDGFGRFPVADFQLKVEFPAAVAEADL
jgi:hypothetical protein